jgi:transcriptional regulatory protein RtcR
VLGERAAEVDLFERAQLEVALRVCRESKSLSDAGRRLFAVSHTRKASSNEPQRKATCSWRWSWFGDAALH